MRFHTADAALLEPHFGTGIHSLPHESNTPVTGPPEGCCLREGSYFHILKACLFCTKYVERYTGTVPVLECP